MTGSSGIGRGMKEEQLGTYSPEMPMLQVSLMDCRCRAGSAGYESMHNERWLRQSMMKDSESTSWGISDLK